MKICTNCGNKLFSEERKCPICKTNTKNAIQVDDNDQERVTEVINSIKIKNNSVQPKKKPKGCLTTIIVLFVVFAIIGALGSGSDKQNNVDVSKPINGAPVEAKADLELLNSEVKNEQYVRYVTGTIKNNTNRQYSYVQVEINLYKGDTLIGSTLDNINNLAAGETWQFKAIVLEDEADNYKIKDITGF